MNEIATTAISMPRWYNTTFLLIIVIRDIIWKGIALWKAGGKRQLTWFVCLLIFSTAGILPIIYLLTRKKGKQKQKYFQSIVKSNKKGGYYEKM